MTAAATVQPQDPHRGGCGFCRWLAPHPSQRCRAPALDGYPIDWPDCRDDSARCGSSGRWWESDIGTVGRMPAGRSAEQPPVDRPADP